MIFEKNKWEKINKANKELLETSIDRNDKKKEQEIIV